MVPLDSSNPMFCSLPDREHGINQEPGNPGLSLPPPQASLKPQRQRFSLMPGDEGPEAQAEKKFIQGPVMLHELGESIF